MATVDEPRIPLLSCGECQKATVNHKNEIKTDNRACNLEWLTSKENTNYGTRNQRAGETLRKRWAEKKAINTQQATAEPI